MIPVSSLNTKNVCENLVTCNSKALHSIILTDSFVYFLLSKKGEALKPRLAHAAGAYLGFCSMKRLGVFLLLLDEMLVHRRSRPRNLLDFPNNSPVPRIYTPGWR